MTWTASRSIKFVLDVQGWQGFTIPVPSASPRAEVESSAKKIRHVLSILALDLASQHAWWLSWRGPRLSGGCGRSDTDAKGWDGCPHVPSEFLATCFWKRYLIKLLVHYINHYYTRGKSKMFWWRKISRNWGQTFSERVFWFPPFPVQKTHLIGWHCLALELRPIHRWHNGHKPILHVWESYRRDFGGPNLCVCVCVSFFFPAIFVFSISQHSLETWDVTRWSCMIMLGPYISGWRL